MVKRQIKIPMKQPMQNQYNIPHWIIRWLHFAQSSLQEGGQHLLDEEEMESIVCTQEG